MAYRIEGVKCPFCGEITPLDAVVDEHNTLVVTPSQWNCVHCGKPLPIPWG